MRHFKHLALPPLHECCVGAGFLWVTGSKWDPKVAQHIQREHNDSTGTRAGLIPPEIQQNFRVTESHQGPYCIEDLPESRRRQLVVIQYTQNEKELCHVFGLDTTQNPVRWFDKQGDEYTEQHIMQSWKCALQERLSRSAPAVTDVRLYFVEFNLCP